MPVRPRSSPAVPAASPRPVARWAAALWIALVAAPAPGAPAGGAARDSGLGDGVAEAELPERPTPAPGVSWWEVRRWTPARRAPARSAAQKGLLLTGETVAVVGRGPKDADCSKQGWFQLDGGAWACGDGMAPTERAPAAQPRLIAFDPPEPHEYRSYRDTGRYDRAPAESTEPLLPFVYGKQWRRWAAPTWASLRDYERGLPPQAALENTTKYHFVKVHETRRGTVLERADGVVVPADQVWIYPVSRFHGRELDRQPVPEGQLAAWVASYTGMHLRADPDPASPAVYKLDHHTALTVAAEPVVNAKGRWFRVPDALAPGVDGWALAGTKGIRVQRPLPRPRQVGEDELWIDVDTGEQTLTVSRGDTPLFITLVSTGEGEEYLTPEGLYRIYDKSIYGDMRSLDDAPEDEAYAVEAVPWVIHFKARYALHGVFWHWGFGHKASHGCVNLSPRDARWVFDHIGPRLPEGWHTVYESPGDTGPLVRVRDAVAKVPDNRHPLP